MQGQSTYDALACVSARFWRILRLHRSHTGPVLSRFDRFFLIRPRAKGGQNHDSEVVDRSCLCFSLSQTCAYCFTCRRLCADTTKCAYFLIRKGIFDWKHALEGLRSPNNQWNIQYGCHDHVKSQM